MNPWLPVGRLDDLPEGEIVPFTQGSSAWILIRRGETVTAFVDRRSHQNIKLSEFGEIQAGVLICHAHGAAFDCRDGKALCFPGTKALQRVPTRVISGQLELHIETEGTE